MMKKYFYVFNKIILRYLLNDDIHIVYTLYNFENGFKLLHILLLCQQKHKDIIPC